ncbi:MAG: tRNA(Ile)-lysidine synthase [Nocardioidaceae bacterium]|jgi:tRNA(Ile)-lysidine synthase|nr:tRNA(Ile)-lysidine synthase [Nocardioidaceae bacterium]
MAGHLHPAVAAVRRAVRTSCADLGPGQRLVVACSGGADSVALAAATLFEARAAGWLVGAAVVDHQLQSGSARVAAGARDLAQTLGCDPADVLTVDVAGSGSGPEGDARAARYRALTAYAAPLGAIILLGHTLDDQAETVLLGLARGSGVRSLSGMPAAWPGFRRPLLGISRQLTHEACAAMGLAVWQDPHNCDTRFARVRVRHEVLPVLERTLGPGVARALSRTAELARQDADALDALAADLLSRALAAGGDGLSVDMLQPAPVAIRRRVLRRWAVDAGVPAGDLTAAHTAAVDRLVTAWHGQLGVDLPGRVQAYRRAGALRVRPAPDR